MHAYASTCRWVFYLIFAIYVIIGIITLSHATATIFAAYAMLPP